MAGADLRNALLERMGWSKQTLSARVQALRKVSPFPTPVAQAVLAHRAGLKLHKFLNEPELKNVQEALALLDRMGSNGSAVQRTAGPSTKPPKEPAAPRFPSQFGTSAPLLSTSKLLEAKEMATIYPLLYVIENSMRELIRRVLSAKYGADWWDTALTSAKAKSVKEKADARRHKEDQMRWHQRRGGAPIDYVDLGDLGRIIAAKQDDFFPGVLGDCRPWFDNFMLELEPSRNVLCHMNPLSRDNANDLKVKAGRWKNLIAGRLDHIPP